MSVVLLDTDVVSFLLKGDTRGQLFAPHLIDCELAIAVMRIAELFKWATVHHWGRRRTQDMEDSLRRFTILPVDIETCRYWASVRAQRMALGLPISPQDAWIAATALRYQILLATHNVCDYQQVPNLELIVSQ